MDKYERMMIAVIAIVLLASLVYLVPLFTGVIESKFPFGVLIPGWLVTLIPIIKQKRLAEKEKLNNEMIEGDEN
ncbi:MAG: hypothetical protein P8Y23_13895 [Candidatus Lokiarchaeota archaeon]